MTEYYKTRILDAYRLHELSGYSIDEVIEHYGYGSSVINKIRGKLNRFASIGAELHDVKSYLNKEYYQSIKALEYYIRFDGKRNRQISAEALANEMGIYDIDTLKNMLRGLAYIAPDIIGYTDTNGLDKLDIL